MVNGEVQEKNGWIKNYLSIVVIHYVAAQQILLLLDSQSLHYEPDSVEFVRKESYFC